MYSTYVVNKCTYLVLLYMWCYSHICGVTAHITTQYTHITAHSTAQYTHIIAHITTQYTHITAHITTQYTHITAHITTQYTHIRYMWCCALDICGVAHGGG